MRKYAAVLAMAITIMRAQQGRQTDPNQDILGIEVWRVYRPDAPIPTLPRSPLVLPKEGYVRLDDVLMGKMGKTRAFSTLVALFKEETKGHATECEIQKVQNFEVTASVLEQVGIRKVDPERIRGVLVEHRDKVNVEGIDLHVRVGTRLYLLDLGKAGILLQSHSEPMDKTGSTAELTGLEFTIRLSEGFATAFKTSGFPSSILQLQ